MSAQRILIAADVEDALLVLLERGWSRGDTVVITTVRDAQAKELTHRGLDVYATTRALQAPFYDEIRSQVAPGRPVSVLSPTAPTVSTPAEFPPSAGVVPLTALGGVSFPAPTSDNNLPPALAADAAVRRLRAAANLFEAAERAMRDGAEQLALIADASPQRAFASTLYNPLTRASVELSTVLESLRNVTSEVS